MVHRITQAIAWAPRKLWANIHQPRIIAIAMCAYYSVLSIGGWSALIDPPTSIAGEVGSQAMTTLAAMLALGAGLGAPSALIGIWWLERTAVLAVTLSTGIYSWIVLTLHATTPGNRLLQASIILGMFIMQAVRWWRIRDKPYDPARHPAPQ